MNLKNLNECIVFNDNQLTKKIAFNDDEVLGFVLNLKAGHTLPVHQHNDSALTLLVLQGSAELQVGNDVQKIQKGTAVMAKGKEEFGIPKVYEDISLFVILSPKPSDPKFSKEI
ncbi:MULTISPECIES: cupin domain-containing protein [unclassified Sedimentibacter]|uniref:cupin domain-containing protein n=1 Tax=unclassified Sedimentibacter TaxID=2649220 RepID=UPI0027E0503D|nr:cupin domain-containing protein [Sedimentibacter sp. MB35-C1]WMJ77390.1 cupin domain-containing protein [Sedimentibacter sp. MB35-C1]